LKPITNLSDTISNPHHIQISEVNEQCSFLEFLQIFLNILDERFTFWMKAFSDIFSNLYTDAEYCQKHSWRVSKSSTSLELISNYFLRKKIHLTCKPQGINKKGRSNFIFLNMEYRLCTYNMNVCCRGNMLTRQVTMRKSRLNRTSNLSSPRCKYIIMFRKKINNALRNSTFLRTWYDYVRIQRKWYVSQLSYSLISSS
jgi:hypothetical protein